VNTPKKTGRPRKNEEREKLTLVSFRADAETLAALAKLEEAALADMPKWREFFRSQGMKVVSPRSAVIRLALIRAARDL
jgi:hypothetical protein